MGGGRTATLRITSWILVITVLLLASGVALGATQSPKDQGASTEVVIGHGDVIRGPSTDVHVSVDRPKAPVDRRTTRPESKAAKEPSPATVPESLQQASPGEACRTGYETGTSVSQTIDPLRLSSETISRMVNRYNEAAAENNLPDFVGDLVEERMLIRVTRGPSHDSTVQLYGVRTGANNRVSDVTQLDDESLPSFDPQIELRVESAVAEGLVTADNPTRLAKEALKTDRIDVAGQGVGNAVKYGVAERVGRIQTKYFESKSAATYEVQSGETRQTDWKGSTVSITRDDLGRTVVKPAEEREQSGAGDTTVIDPTTGISIGVTPGSCCRSLMSVHTGELSQTAGMYASLAELGCPHECSVDGSHTTKIEMVLVQQGWDPDEYEDAQTWINTVGTIGSIADGDLTGLIYGGEFLDTGFAAGKTRGFTVWAKATCQECDVNTCYGCWNESDLVHDGVRYKKVAEFPEGVTATGDTDDDGRTEFKPVRKPEGYVGADFTWEQFDNQLFSPVASDLRVQCRNEEGF